MSAARSWKSYNIAKERRFMERTAWQLEVPRTCEDCGGKGLDLGSLNEPEACPTCSGSGVIQPEERIERKPIGRVTGEPKRKRRVGE